MVSASEKNREGGCWIFSWVVRGSLTKLALEQRSEEGDGAGRGQAPGQAGLSALEQVFLVCSRIKKTSVAGVESGAERVLGTEVKVKGRLFMTLYAMGRTLASILRRETTGGTFERSKSLKESLVRGLPAIS